MQSIDSVETYPYGMSKDLNGREERLRELML